MSTKPNTPPMQVSDEAEEKTLKLAREQGKAYKQTLDYMAHEEADTGGEKPAGNYIVAYAVEKAEGLYHLDGNDLIWREPDQENAHIEISVRDAADNRFIPGLTVHLTVTDSNGKQVGRHQQHFLWHPWLYHYGRNWQLPGDGMYALQVDIDPPQFHRHDKKNGKRYAEPVKVTFESVNIKTGQKK